MKKLLKQIKYMFGGKYAGYCVLGLAVLLCFLQAVEIGLIGAYISDFYPINGSWQSYNLFRRILAGQVPYVDFANYLGMGVVLLNVPFLLLHNTFTMSLWVTHIGNYLCFTACILAILQLTTRSWRLTLFFYLLIWWCWIFFLKYAAGKLFFELSFFSLYFPGDSLRMERAILPLILIVFLLITLRWRREDVFSFFSRWRNIFIGGVISGLFLIWANDFGVACLLGYPLIICLLLLYHREPFAVRKLAALAVSLPLGSLAGVTIVTLGRPWRWFEFTREVAQDQFWYFGTTSDKICSPLQLLDGTGVFFLFLLILYGVYFFMIYLKFRRHALTGNHILVFYLNLCSLIAALLYLAGSGRISSEVLSLTILVTFLGIAVSRIPLTGRKLIQCVFLPVLLTITVGVCGLKVARKISHKRCEVPYVQELDGYNSRGDELKILKQHLDDKHFFSVYAGPLEVMTGKIQEGEVDYVIHALGDRSRSRFLEHFRSGTNDCVISVNLENVVYAGWIKRANWFIYREIMKNYHPVVSTQYYILWERSVQSKKEYAVPVITLNQLSPGSVEFVVHLAEPGERIVEICIDYETVWRLNPARFLTWRKCLMVTDESMKTEGKDGRMHYYLRESGNQVIVPVFIRDGRGKLVLSSYPMNCTVLNLKQFRCESVLWNR